MIPSQTVDVLLGTLTAFLYAGATLGIGLSLLLLCMGRRGYAAVRARVGLCAFVWLAFVAGQGILGAVWLVLSLAGLLHPTLVGIICVLGWSFLGAVLLAFRVPLTQAVRRRAGLSFLHIRSWYHWVAIGVAVVVLLRGVIALLPPTVNDALGKYLITPKMIAFNHSLEFQSYASPFHGLLPLQVELHWAALFSISNETAVTVWDYFCASSLLAGIGLLTLSLVSSRRAALFAVLVMLTTPGFAALMGAAKSDNAGAQYGMAALLWLIAWPALRRPAALLAGLSLGWALASRYTNVIFVPAFVTFAAMMIRRLRKEFAIGQAVERLKNSWVTDALVCGSAVGLATGSMLIKNWVLVGCPLAPQFGCEEEYWRVVFSTLTSGKQNISLLDLMLYPFVWTFADREKMLGNISPLFLGFFPFLLIYRRSSTVKPALAACRT